MTPNRLPTRHASHLARALLALALPGATTLALAASPAASSCPDYFFLSGQLAANTDFETPDAGVPAGTTTCWKNGDPLPAHSAADGWLMHSSNSGAKVCSTLIASTAPGHVAGSRMVKFMAKGNEGGLTQSISGVAGHAYMFSAWVKVLSGQVAIQPNGGNLGPVSWSSKTGEWEQLRACVNSTGALNLLDILNQDPNGGTFFVDRVEVREMPVRE